MNSVQIKAGDTVRSFDFASVGNREVTGAAACFVEGVVEATLVRIPDGYEVYKIRVTRRVSSGKEVDLAKYPDRVYPPVNGTPCMFGGPTDGVCKLSPSAEAEEGTQTHAAR